jgi:hypothetical protein
MDAARDRECMRYGLDAAAIDGSAESAAGGLRRRWWDYAILAAAAGVFVALAWNARQPELTMNMAWLVALVLVMVASVVAGARALWKTTRFT